MSAHILICGVNWLGDAVMSLPATAAFLAENAGARVSLLVKPPLVPFWRMVPALHDVIALEATGAGTLRAAAAVRAGRFDRAIVLPNSFRSALIPFLAGIRDRRGAAGPLRGWMLNDRVARAAPTSPDLRHQAWECMRLMGVQAPPARLALPRLDPGDTARESAGKVLPWLPGTPWVAMLPGAARGPSKRWPPDRFTAVGRRLADERGLRVAVLGSRAEGDVCRHVAAGIGEAAVCLAGRTSLPELVALLSGCRVALSNDSGGMHLAAAAGAPVVAVFGLTDPAVTGPIGDGHRVVAAAGVARGRDIPRRSAEAERALAAVGVDEVVKAALEALDGAATRPGGSRTREREEGGDPSSLTHHGRIQVEGSGHR